MDLHDTFTTAIFSHLTNNKSDRLKGGLIKTHTDSLNKYGEYSFPLKIEPWIRYVKLAENSDTKGKDAKTIFEFTYQNTTLTEACEKLTASSKEWPFRIQRCDFKNGRIHIFLDRISTTRLCLEKLSNLLEFKNSQRETIQMSIQEKLDDDISSKRLHLLCDVFRNLVILKGDIILTQQDSSKDFKRHVYFTRKSNDKKYEDSSNVFCAAVLNKKTGAKEIELTPNLYFEKRKLDMQLMAEHKYGLRVKNEDRWKVFLNQLGDAAVTFDLLQIRPSNPVTISLNDNGTGNSKGASFVLYNGARLASIIDTFNNNVNINHYPPLPVLNEINKELLNDEDEWILVFNFILAYPGIIKKCLDFESKESMLAPHLLCTFLSGMTGRISMYYRRVRILMEPRKHLIPLIHARVQLLMAIQSVLKHALEILNIVPVTQM